MKSREKKVGKVFDNLMWYFIYLMPFIITILTMICNSKIHFADNTFTFDFITSLNNTLNNFTSTNNIVYTTLDSIFGANGIITLFNNTTLILYFTYFINCLIIHVIVDILALLPRISEKLIDKAGK